MTIVVPQQEEPLINCRAAALAEDEGQEFEAHVGSLGGGFTIRRALPLRERRMIGAWCFLDHIGPFDIQPDGEKMLVRPHPHIGLQTVTWLFSGEVQHRDSLGYHLVIRPGELNVMTSGNGICHSEETPQEYTPHIHGVQLWVALPESRRHGESLFEHLESVPTCTLGTIQISVFAGTFNGLTSPASWFTPLVGLDVQIQEAGEHTLPLQPGFEHGFMVVDGEVEIAGHTMSAGRLLYIRPGRDAICLRTSGAARLIVIGGEPFESPILMWWNFVARTREEIVQAREDWQAVSDRFGRVPGWGDERIDAPVNLPAAPR
jgi:quercetin 2,3-dioxygenase